MDIYKISFLFFSWLCSCVILFADEPKSEESHQGIICLTLEQIRDNQIEISNASSATLRQTVSVPAKITVNELHQVVVIGKAPGIVTKINKNIGDTVQENETLAILESKEIADTKAAYLAATKREALAARTLKAEEGLKEKKISSEQDYLRTLLAAEEAHINLEVAAQQLSILGMNAADLLQLKNDGLNELCCYKIKAPLNGVIIDKNIILGSLVEANTEVFKIANLETVWVELGINSNNITKIKPGHKIILKSLKGDLPTAEAEITHVSPLIDEHTRTATAIALLSNSSGNWYPGSFVRAEIIVDEFQVPIAVLKEAVQDIDEKNVVFINHPEGFEKREVKIGRSDGSYVEILSGLEPNTPYAAVNAFVLKAEDCKKDAEL